MDNPLVSVVIPVYNVDPFLEECLNSIISQTYRNLEILIVDDGSNDGSEFLCDEFQRRDARVQVFHQTNQGVSAARNVALDHMTGDLVVFCDSDDYFFPDYVRRLVEKIEESNSDIAVCGFEARDIQGNKLTEYSFAKEEIISRNDALRSLVNKTLDIAVWSKMYRGLIWKTLRFPEGRLFEDTCVMYKVLNSTKKVHLIPDVLMTYRVHNGSITKTYSIKHTQDWIDATAQYEAFLSTIIPEVISNKDLELEREKNLMFMIVRWVRTRGEKNEQVRLRRDIIQRGEKCIKTIWKLSTHIAFWLFRYFPGMIPIVLPCALRIAKIVNAVSQKR